VSVPGLIKNCSGVILAGGENRRMPVTKSFIRIDGEKIIERNISILKSIFKEVLIVTDQPEKYLYLRVPLLGDSYNVRGPMTGIFTSLMNSSMPWVFISACDMPFINKELIRYMSSKINNCDSVAPLINNRIEPLFAYYSRRLMGKMEKSLVSGKTGLQDFLSGKRVKYIRGGEIKKIDTLQRSFININTPDDVKLYLNPGNN
jgi:molybdopterin-guanine dinucleotide biosynthesis protein A